MLIPLLQQSNAMLMVVLMSLWNVANYGTECNSQVRALMTTWFHSGSLLKHATSALRVFIDYM